jgi:hypothetical protein
MKKTPNNLINSYKNGSNSMLNYEDKIHQNKETQDIQFFAEESTSKCSSLFALSSKKSCHDLAQDTQVILTAQPAITKKTATNELLDEDSDENWF